MRRFFIKYDPDLEHWCLFIENKDGCGSPLANWDFFDSFKTSKEAREYGYKLAQKEIRPIF